MLHGCMTKNNIGILWTEFVSYWIILIPIGWLFIDNSENVIEIKYPVSDFIYILLKQTSTGNSIFILNSASFIYKKYKL